MFGKYFSKVLSITATVFILAACGKQSGDGNRGQYAPGLSDDSSTIVVQNSSSSSSNSTSAPTIGCGVSLSADTVASGQIVSITVNASGGTAPYKLKVTENYGTFASSQTVTGSYTNTTTTNRIVEKKFAVVDANNYEGQCYFKVTVLPSNAPITPAQCTLTAAPVNPVVNQFFNLTLIPAFTGNYTLRSLQLQNDWTLYPNSVNSTNVLYQVKYTSLGARTVTAVIERNGAQFSCSLNLNVAASGSGGTPTTGPAVAINVAPALKLQVGGTFTVSPVLSGFAASPAPTIQVSSNDQTIVITPSGSNYLITGNNTARKFLITVSASQGTGTAAIVQSASIELEYTTGIPNQASCTMEAPVGLVQVGEFVSIPLKVVGSPNEPVQYSYVEAGLNAQVAPGMFAPIQVRFATPGIRTVTVSGARNSQGILCNGTGIMQVAVNVAATFASCDAKINPIVSIAGTTVKAQIVLPPNNVPADSLEVKMTATSPDFQLIKILNATEAMVRFTKPGVYAITMTAKDLRNGSMVTCQTNHQSVAANLFAVAQDEPGNLVHVYRGVPAQDLGTFQPFADVLPNFTGGIRVATADITGDGIVDVVTAAGYNGGLRVRAWDGANLQIKIRDFIAFAGINTGANRTYIAAGDVNADGFAEIVVGAGCNANAPWVEVYDGKTGALTVRFKSSGDNKGNRVAVGDVNGDGYSDIVTSSCSCADIKAFSGQAIVASQVPVPFMAFNAYPGVDTDVKVAVGDVNGDGRADIITGTNGSRAPYVKIFSSNPNVWAGYSLIPFNNIRGINFVGAGDVNGDGMADVIVGGDGTKGPEEVKVFNSNGFSELIGPSSLYGSLFPFGTRRCERIYVAGGAGAL